MYENWQSGLKTKLENVIRFEFEHLEDADKIKEINAKINEIDRKKKNLESLSFAFAEVEESVTEVVEAVETLDKERKELEKELKNIENIQSLDIGKYHEFGDLIGKKLETEIQKYGYIIEFFEKASQKDGNTKYSLG